MTDTSVALPTDRQPPTIQTQLAKYKPVIQKLLAGTTVTEETFVAQIANAIRSTPKLAECEVGSLFGAAMKCAQLGLAPNDTRNLAWIIPYKGQASFQLGYGGVMELARRAVPGLGFDGQTVYEHDEFDIDYGKAEPLTHRPAIVKGIKDRGEPIAWYVRAIYPGGRVQVHMLTRDDVEYHRGFSKQPQGQMWTDSYNAAALKSVVTDMKRWLPSSPAMAAAFDADDETVHIDHVEPIEADYDRTDSEEADNGE